MGEWDKRPGVEKHVIGAHSCSGIPFGPLWLHCHSLAVFVCMPVTKVCALEYVLHQVCCVSAVTCVTHFELKAGLKGSEFLQEVWAHLVVIGRRKKGPCVLGTGSRRLTQPNVTQPSTVQNQPTWEKNTNGTAPHSWTLPTYPDCRPILIIPQQSPWQHFFRKQCSVLFHSFHFNMRT